MRKRLGSAVAVLALLFGSVIAFASPAAAVPCGGSSAYVSREAVAGDNLYIYTYRVSYYNCSSLTVRVKPNTGPFSNYQCKTVTPYQVATWIYQKNSNEFYTYFRGMYSC